MSPNIMQPLAICSVGMVTPVGYDAPSTCAAIRVNIDNIHDTYFMFDGDWIQGCQVPFEENWRGIKKLLILLGMSIAECLENVIIGPDRIPIIICLAENERSSHYTNLIECIKENLTDYLGHYSDKAHIFEIITEGRVGGVKAIDMAGDLLNKGFKSCIVAGVDSFLTKKTLTHFHHQRRLLTEKNHDGFLPGEAAGAVLIEKYDKKNPRLTCFGLGFSKERAFIGSNEPLRAEGMLQAVKTAFSTSRMTFRDIDYRIADISGEQYGFKEASLVLSRSMKSVKEELDLWHPAECIGEIGAAIVPVVLGIAHYASYKGYAPGPGVLCHFANDSGERAAMVLKYI